MYDLNTNVKSKSGLSADQLNSMVAGHGLAGTGQSFINGENAHGINALFALAHAIIESAWGDSYFAQQRNNLFGINAVDSNPALAYGYPSKAACIDYYFSFLDHSYLTPGGSWFEGTTIHSIFIHYSSSHDVEGQNIANIMNQLLGKVSAAPQAPVSTPVQPVVQTSGPIYTVQSGDTLSAIAAAHGMSLARIEQLNTQIADFNLIHPGDQIHISGAAPVAVTPAANPQYYTVKPGDNLSAIAESHGITSLGQLESWNPSAGHPAGNFNNIWPGDKVRVA